MLLEILLVVAITDGYTIKVLDRNNQQIKVRLASIDAPERKQPFGTKSKQMLANLIGNKKESIKKRGVLLSSLSHAYDLDDTQSLTDLSTVPNEKLFHQDRPSWSESDDLASPSDSRIYIISRFTPHDPNRFWLGR